MSMGLRREMLAGMASGVKLVEKGTYTPETDVAASTVSISHSLGVAPDFIIAMSDSFEALESMTQRYIANSYFSKKNMIASNATGSYMGWYMTNFPERDTVWNSPENLSTLKFADSSSFKIPYYNTQDKLKAGVTYHYVIGKYE